MALTTPDGLPYPTDYADPADTPAALEALALATQAAMPPVGLISMWPGATTPAGWHLCDGSPHGSSALAAVIGPNTPDLRNLFVVGAGGSYAVGATGGADSVTLNESQIPNHTHVVTSSTSVVSSDQGSQQGSPYNAGALATLPQSRETSYTGGGGSHENRPPFFALTYIIRKA